MNLLVHGKFRAAAWALLLGFGLAAAALATGCSGSAAQESDQGAAETAAESVQDEANAGEPENGQSDEGQQEAAEGSVATPSTAGALRVVGSQLCGENGEPVQLRGVSTHGLAWYPGYVNRDFFRELRDDWNANVVRLAMYTAESGGYCTDGDRAKLYDLVCEGVGYAADADLYAIVDWHILSDGNPLQHADAAADFFARISADLAASNNVIYEICNEPNGGTSWDDVKAYAERIIPIIRANDPDAVIIVGTPTWSQEVDKAVASPLSADNVMYAMHFYAATHKDDLRNRMQTAVEQGLPVLVSEFGICDASGNGQVDCDSANAWVSAMDSLGVSYVCWNLSNKNEASALFKSSCEKTSGFTEDDLSAEGVWLRGVLHGENAASGLAANASLTSAAASAASGAASGNGVALQGSTGSFGWTATVVNRWSSNGENYYQYSASVTNEGSAAVAEWEVRLPLAAAVSISDSWNASVSVDGSELVLKSASYNGNLAPQVTAQDIGFIVKGDSSLPAAGPVAS